MTVRIGVIGTGFVARHFVLALDKRDGFEVSKVLTRRRPSDCRGFPLSDELTQDVHAVVEKSDVVLECSGDPVYAADVVDLAMQGGRPVVTMNSEFHVTVGSYFVTRGLISEAEGDQPGCQAALKEEAEELGFKLLVYGNMKGFQNYNPTPQEMKYWAEKQGLSLPMVTSFTDGTKLQTEQALVANGLGADVAKPGLIGPETDDLQAASDLLAARARQIEIPISDYVLSRKLPHGVFVVGTHDARQQACLRYLKLGDGPYYIIQRTNIFIHLEIMKTIRRIIETETVLLNNSAGPRISVATVAKRELVPGMRIGQGIGSFDVRGTAVRMDENPGHVPIGLMQNAVVRRRVEPSQMLSFDDVEMEHESLALNAWRDIERAVLKPARAA